MKKYLYIALAAAAFTSCSQDESLDVLKEAIAFGDAFVENSTRAIDPSYNNDTKKIEAFKVWGNVKANNGSTYVPVFAGANVTDDGNNNTTIAYGQAWKCDVTQYWIYGAPYNFAAVVNGTVDNELNNGLPKTISYTADGTTDLLYAEQLNVTRIADQTDDQKIVAFTFNHLLSKVMFTAKNTTGDTKYTYNIKNLTITNSLASGSYTVTTKNWADKSTGTNSGTSFGAIDAVSEAATGKTCESEKLLIPADYTSTKLNISFTLEWCYNSEVITSTSQALEASVNLEAGKAYNFTISAGLNKPIEFTVHTLTGWSDANPQPGELEF